MSIIKGDMMFSRLIEVIREKGIKKGLKRAFDKLTGRADINDKLDTLYYLFNRYADIEKFPKAEGDLRKLQLCDAQLLKIFDAVCKKHGFSYWLDFGTLLGAVRHKGFIPWDDDLDVSMPREDFEKAMEVLPEEMKTYGIDVVPFDLWPDAVFGFSYRHKETGIWLDVFPADRYYVEDYSDEKLSGISKSLQDYQKYYLKKRLKISKQDMFKAKDKFVSTYSQSTKNTAGYICNDPEFDTWVCLHKINVVYPLSEISFENFVFYAPGNADLYLKNYYGVSYMSFPVSGVEHHGDDGNRLREWAKMNNVDMNSVLEELKEIEKKYSEQ